MWRAERRPPRPATDADTTGLRFSARHPLILRKAEGRNRRLLGTITSQADAGRTGR